MPAVSPTAPATVNSSSASKVPTTSPRTGPTAAPEPYELSTDWWNGHVEAEVGPNYGRLLQLYGVHKTMREAAKKHLRVTRRQETDGSIKLTLAA